MRLNDNSIQEAIKKLKDYRDSIETKTENAIRTLVDMGYDVAMADYGDYGKYITINRQITVYGSTVKELMIVTDIPIISTWETLQGQKSVAISPMLMAEFGSGWEAEVKQESAKSLNVGQGTFPGQTHAFDVNGWSWKDKDNKWHHSKGIKPTHPLYNATMDMIANYKKVFRDAFR